MVLLAGVLQWLLKTAEMEKKLQLIQVTFLHIKNSYADMKSLADEDAAGTEAGERTGEMEKGVSVSDLSLNICETFTRY